MQPQPAASQSKSTQNSLLISEIRDGIVILKDGSLRAVVLASAINFDLMNPQEREGVELAYQGFLNSMHFPIQIVVRSQKIDLDAYIEHLTKLRADQDNELLGLLMDDYVANVSSLVEEVNIMDKQFYVVVPLFPPAVNVKNGIFDGLKNAIKNSEVITVPEAQFQQYKVELSQRVQLVASGLNQLGVRAVPLDTQELIELYYSFYNPDVAANQKLIDAGQLQTTAVTRKGQPPAAASPQPVITPTQPAPQQPEAMPQIPMQPGVAQPVQDPAPPPANPSDSQTPGGAA